MASAQTVGYDWVNNTISALFQPNALNGDTNPARYFAITAMLVYCLTLVFIFRIVAKNSISKFHRKTIEIAGIGFAVYAFLIVTPMHNLMVSIALVFFLVTVVSMLHNLYLQKNIPLLIMGIVCISIPLINATLYYGDFIYEILPAVQKTGSLACAVWFILVYYYNQRTITNQNVHITSLKRTMSRARSFPMVCLRSRDIHFSSSRQFHLMAWSVRRSSVTLPASKHLYGLISVTPDGAVLPRRTIPDLKPNQQPMSQSSGASVQLLPSGCSVMRSGL